MIYHGNLDGHGGVASDASLTRWTRSSRQAVPILRAPPFPGAQPRGWPTPRICAADSAEIVSDRVARLAGLMASAQVGGAFWRRSLPDGPAAWVLRPRSWRESIAWARACREMGAPMIVSLPDAAWARLARPGFGKDAIVTTGAVDPWSLLRRAKVVIAASDDELTVLAAAAGIAVANDPSAPAVVDRSLLAPRLLRSFAYHDPFSGAPIDAERWVEFLGDWRRQIDANRGIVAMLGIAPWKRPSMRRFLWTGEDARKVVTRGVVAPGDRVVIWPSRVSPRRVADLERAGAQIIRAEDGFIRSNGLGCHLHPPMSVAIDPLGIHYDPTRPSLLERLLAEADFPADLLARAEALIARAVAGGVSKYGADAGDAVRLPQHRRRVLVAGQVEDDLSMRLGGLGIGNLELMIRARTAEPGAFLVYKPHPDVVAGLRQGHVEDRLAHSLADLVVHDAPIATLLDQVDAVHAVTSLTGFEALLRGRAVITHGQPFYAGWGLTHDLGPAVPRRGRALSLAQLVAAALILYPRYLDPDTRLPCPPEVLIDRLTRDPAIKPNGLQRLRALQGRLARSRPRRVLGAAT